MTRGRGRNNASVPKKAKEDAVRVRARLLLGVTIAWSPRIRAAALRRRLPIRPVRVVIGFGRCRRRSRGAHRRRPHERHPRQQIVVENRPGAGSSIAAEYVARAPKDGYSC